MPGAFALAEKASKPAPYDKRKLAEEIDGGKWRCLYNFGPGAGRCHQILASNKRSNIVRHYIKVHSKRAKELGLDKEGEARAAAAPPPREEVRGVLLLPYMVGIGHRQCVADFVIVLPVFASRHLY
jgi:hypothetical protein